MPLDHAWRLPYRPDEFFREQEDYPLHLFLGSAQVPVCRARDVWRDESVAPEAEEIVRRCRNCLRRAPEKLIDAPLATADLEA